MGGEGAGSNPWFGGDARGASDAKKATDSNRSNMSTKSSAGVRDKDDTARAKPAGPSPRARST